MHSVCCALLISNTSLWKTSLSKYEIAILFLWQKPNVCTLLPRGIFWAAMTSFIWMRASTYYDVVLAAQFNTLSTVMFQAYLSTQIAISLFIYFWYLNRISYLDWWINKINISQINTDWKIVCQTTQKPLQKISLIYDKYGKCWLKLARFVCQKTAYGKLKKMQIIIVYKFYVLFLFLIYRPKNYFKEPGTNQPIKISMIYCLIISSLSKV